MNEPQWTMLSHALGVPSDHAITGSVSVHLDSLEPFYNPAEFVTLTIVYRANWWKRPILWLLRRPTKRITTVPNARIEGFSIEQDGSTTVGFVAAPRTS